MHSEYNHTDIPLTLYQIWIETNQPNVTPRWEGKLFPVKAVSNQLPLLVSGYAENEGEALFIHQTARIFGGRITKEAEINHMIDHQAYILASQDSFELQDELYIRSADLITGT